MAWRSSTRSTVFGPQRQRADWIRQLGSLLWTFQRSDDRLIWTTQRNVSLARATGSGRVVMSSLQESRLRAFAAKLRSFLRGHQPDSELDNEVQEHLQL